VTRTLRPQILAVLMCVTQQMGIKIIPISMFLDFPKRLNSIVRKIMRMQFTVIHVKLQLKREMFGLTAVKRYARNDILVVELIAINQRTPIIVLIMMTLIKLVVYAGC
jgi:hypothetical protein